jgi:hypothetical protein
MNQQGKKTNGTDDLATVAAEARTKNERSSHNKRINECFYFDGKKIDASAADGGWSTEKNELLK